MCFWILCLSSACLSICLFSMTIDITGYRMSLNLYGQASFDDVGQLPVGSNSGAYSDIRVITSIFPAIPSPISTLPAQTSGAIHFVHCTLRLRRPYLWFHSRVVVSCQAPTAQAISPPFPYLVSHFTSPIISIYVRWLTPFGSFLPHKFTDPCLLSSRGPHVPWRIHFDKKKYNILIFNHKN